MKKSLIVASLLMIGTSSALVAAEMGNAWFVGGEFGGVKMYNKASGSANIPSQGIDIEGSGKYNFNSTYEAIKVGKYFDLGRVYGSLGYQNKKEDLSSYTFGLGYDYLFKNKSDFTPFIGLNASYTKAKIDDEDMKALSFDKPKGFNYGPEAGFLYAITKNTELEIGIRYMMSDVKETVFIDNGTDTADAKIETEKFIQYYIGLNYKF